MKNTIICSFLALVTGCATAAYDHTITVPGTNGVATIEHTSGHIRSLMSTSSMSGFALGKETKTTKSGLTIKDANTDPNTQFLEAIGGLMNGAISSAVQAAKKP